MKRGQLIAAIDAAPNVYFRSAVFGLLALQKGSIKDAIKAKFPGRADETGMRLDADHAFAPDTDTET